MQHAINLTNQKFGKLRVIKRADNTSDNKVHWRCKCDCGRTTVVRSASLRSGDTKSCGCLIGFRHGFRYRPEYIAYCAAKQRCNYKKGRQWADYGGRGIKFLFNSFLDFYQAVGSRPSKKHTIDRIDNDGNYEKGNTRWATRKQQQRNKRNGGKWLKKQ